MEIPDVEKFKKDAEIILIQLAAFNAFAQPTNEMAVLIIARGLLRSYTEGGNTVFDNITESIESRIKLLNAKSVTTA